MGSSSGGAWESSSRSWQSETKFRSLEEKTTGKKICNNRNSDVLESMQKVDVMDAADFRKMICDFQAN